MWTPTRTFQAVLAVLGLILLLSMGGNLFENLNASDQMVIQYPSGDLETFTTPGWKPQWFGRVTKYRKRTNFEFLAPERGKKGDDLSIEVRFNDAGHGRISGMLAYELPVDKATFIRLHSLYGSQAAVEKQLVAPAVTKAIYMTGPLMSSKESYADRRPELLSMIDDQIKNGVYRTRSFQKKEIDPTSGQEKTVTVVEVLRDSSGRMAREDQSSLSEFQIKTFNLAINGVIYSPEVEQQIKEQQQMTMAVQTSMMEAKRAEQQRITAEQNGMAQAAKAKWDQEVIKATEVTEAQKRRDVAQLDVVTAAARKQESILSGEGEAAKKRLAMQANGALEQKLAAWIEVNKNYASAIENYGGNWQPQVQMGGSNKPGGGAMDLVDLLTAKTARDIGLEISPANRTKK